ncbi:MAG: cystathionine beta-lyase [Azospirillum sp.]|nr:cystathionine beta-lyase [Azospirillum sp.]
MDDETRYVQSNDRPVGSFDGLTAPIYRASTVVFPTASAFERRYEQFYDGYTYGLYGTPTSRVLEKALADLASASDTVLTPSGQSALTLTLSAFVHPGDRILVVDTCYGPVRAYCDQYLARLGVNVTYFDPGVGGRIDTLIDPRTRLILLESPGSNTMEFMDVPAIAAAARKRGCLVLMDNTWATSLLYKPHLHGVDVVVEALSKHAAGHGDVLMGAITTVDRALFRRLKDMTRLVGLGVSADECSLVLRGLATLPVRMARAAETALKLAEWLHAQPSIARVLHPAFSDCPGHDLWRRDIGRSNGLFSVVPTKTAQPNINAFVDALRLFKIGASWGGTHSLVAPQDPTGARCATRWTEGRIVRFSVGLESPTDLLADLEQALPRLLRKIDPANPLLGEFVP